VKAFDLAAGLRVVGPGVVKADAAGGEGDLEGDAAVTAGAPVNTAALSDSSDAGSHGWQRFCGTDARRQGL